jgi:hypothetical protein
LLRDAKKKLLKIDILVMDIPIEWFDEVSHCLNSKCGAGGMIKINRSISYKWKLNCGVGTNTRGEVLGVWDLLLMTTILKIYHLQVVGDSKFIINWLNHRSYIQATCFHFWKECIQNLILDISYISLSHI